MYFNSVSWPIFSKLNFPPFPSFAILLARFFFLKQPLYQDKPWTIFMHLVPSRGPRTQRVLSSLNLGQFVQGQIHTQLEVDPDEARTKKARNYRILPWGSASVWRTQINSQLSRGPFKRNLCNFVFADLNWIPKQTEEPLVHNKFDFDSETFLLACWTELEWNHSELVVKLHDFIKFI